MAEADPLRKYVEAGIAFTQLTKARAEAIVRELVKVGDVQREQAQDRVEELLDRSRKSTEGLVGLVRREIAQQLSSLGFAKQEDVDRLEARLEGGLQATTAAKPPPAPAGGAAAAGKTAAAGKAAKGAPGKAGATAKATKPTKATGKATKAATTVTGAAAKARPPADKAGATPPPGTAARTAGAPKVSRRRPGPGPDAPREQG